VFPQWKFSQNLTAFSKRCWFSVISIITDFEENPFKMQTDTVRNLIVPPRSKRFAIGIYVHRQQAIDEWTAVTAAV
jgi:hypothetical protein